MRLILALAFTAWPTAAGCLSFMTTEAASACSTQSAEVRWLNAPPKPETLVSTNRTYDPALRDAALSTGVYAEGDARFEFAPRGTHLVEVFIMVADDGKANFVLEAGGAVVDDRYMLRTTAVRLRPRRGLRRFSLSAMVEGPVELAVRTDASRYVLSAVRWSTQREFEEELVPRWRERARHLTATPLFEGQEGGPGARRNYLQQLYDRLYLSNQPGLRKEAVIGLARAWYWVAAENHEPNDIARTAEYFEEALRLAPQDLVVRQMISASCSGLNVGRGAVAQGKFCGEVRPVRWEVRVPPAPKGAPAWAVEQRLLARRMEALTSWWVEKRQQPNGELGGGWGDDVEILRYWGPQALGFGSKTAALGVRRLADGLWNSGSLLHGYDRGISDVEHSSEPTTDTGPLLAALYPSDADAVGRLRETSACAEYWIGPQADGRYRFHSSWFNCRERDRSPERAVDVFMNVRAMGPALWYAYLSRDARLIALLGRWAESWIEAMRRTEHGKPAGIFPSAVRSADGGYLVKSDRWDKPDAEWDYFQWSGGSQEALTSLLLAMHELTGEQKWLKAAGESFQILAGCSAHPHLCDAMKRAPEAFYEWRRKSGDPRYDAFHGYDPKPDDTAVLARLARQARETTERLAYNFDMFTSEVMYTDRVYYALPSAYRQYLFGGEAPRGERPPTFHVTWPPGDADYARAVLEASQERLRLRLYNFENRAGSVPVRVWRLTPGDYRWETRDLSGKTIASGQATVARLPEDLTVTIPGQREVNVVISPAGR